LFSVRVAKSGDANVEQELALWGNKFRRSIVETFNFFHQYITFKVDGEALIFVIEGDIAKELLGMGDSEELGEKLGHPIAVVDAGELKRKEVWRWKIHFDTLHLMKCVHPMLSCSSARCNKV
jgi:hypothetical protein